MRLRLLAVVAVAFLSIATGCPPPLTPFQPTSDDIDEEIDAGSSTDSGPSDANGSAEMDSGESEDGAVPDDASDSGSTTDAGMPWTVTQTLYLKAGNAEAEDGFGWRAALSADGTTLAIGAPYEDCDATGVNGMATNNLAADSGAVYVWKQDGGGGWVQEAYIKASNTGAGDRFGWSLALSDDGNTLAVGASREDSDATGIAGADNDDAADSGAVYVFTRSGSTWTQQEYIKATNTGASDYFGHAVALSQDGNTLAVGATGESSDASGIDGADNDNAPGSGAVYVYTRTDDTWSPEAYIKASNTFDEDNFGRSISLSGSGDRLAVGAMQEDSAGTGVDSGEQGSDGALDSGAVYIFSRTGTDWSQEAYVKASNTGAGDFFGDAVALSADGSTLVVGAPFESSGASGIGGDQTNNDAASSGAVYAFRRGTDTWVQEEYIKASNTGAQDRFGWAVSISGTTLAVAALGEASNAVGIDGDQENDDVAFSGAVYLFGGGNGDEWIQTSYVKASNTSASDYFGNSIALSPDANTLIVGARQEDGNGTGVGGDEDNDDTEDSGAIYTFSIEH